MKKKPKTKIMGNNFLILQAIQPTPLDLAFVRKLLSDKVYIEIDNNFIVSCNRSFKDSLSKDINNANLNFIIVYVETKAGCDVFALGINDSDKETIENIVIYE